MPKVLVDMSRLEAYEPHGQNGWSLFVPALVERAVEPATTIMGFGSNLPQALRDLAYHIEYTEKLGMTVQEEFGMGR